MAAARELLRVPLDTEEEAPAGDIDGLDPLDQTVWRMLLTSTVSAHRTSARQLPGFTLTGWCASVRGRGVSPIP